MLRSVRRPSSPWERKGPGPRPRYRPWPNCFETEMDTSLRCLPDIRKDRAGGGSQSRAVALGLRASGSGTRRAGLCVRSGLTPRPPYPRSRNGFETGMLPSVRRPSLLYERWGRGPRQRYRPWPNCFETNDGIRRFDASQTLGKMGPEAMASLGAAASGLGVSGPGTRRADFTADRVGNSQHICTGHELGLVEIISTKAPGSIARRPASTGFASDQAQAGRQRRQRSGQKNVFGWRNRRFLLNPLSFADRLPYTDLQGR